MPLIVILSIAIQAVLIAHVIKTGRNMLWILAIFFLPPAGPIAYVAVEILPELFGGRTARRAKSGMQRMIDPNRDLRRASVEVEVSGNVDARRRPLPRPRGDLTREIASARGAMFPFGRAVTAAATHRRTGRADLPAGTMLSLGRSKKLGQTASCLHDRSDSRRE